MDSCDFGGSPKDCSDQGGSDQDHPQEKKMQKGRIVV